MAVQRGQERWWRWHSSFTKTKITQKLGNASTGPSWWWVGVVTNARWANQGKILLLNLTQRDCLAAINWKGQTETTSGCGKCHLVSYAPLLVPVPPGLCPAKKAKHMQCGVALLWRLNESLLHDKHSPVAKEPNETSMSFLQLLQSLSHHFQHGKQVDLRRLTTGCFTTQKPG